MRAAKVLTAVVSVALAAGSLAACSSDDDEGGGSTSQGKVELTYWAWATKIEDAVAKWNASHPNIHVTVSRQAQGDELVTKVLTAAKAGNPPDLVQAEYQALPTLVSNDVVADIKKQAEPVKDKFAEGVWQQVTLGTDAVYAIPQDSGPMMLYYRKDLFQQYGLSVPQTWDEFAQAARTLRTKTKKQYLTTFSANDPGWFAGLSQQAGANWWKVDGDTWQVAINDPATKKVADYWSGLVSEGVVDNKPMYTPEWNKALNDGTLLAWPSAIWGAGVLEGIAASTKGKWAMVPLPQWTAGENKTGSWGGSSTAVTAKSKNIEAAVEFATWLNTEASSVETMITAGALYPAARDGQSSPALQKPPAFIPDQTDFYPTAKAIADTAAGVTWGPNVNVAYQAYKDAFGAAITGKRPFSTALDQMQQTTVADMQKNGFKVAS